MSKRKNAKLFANKLKGLENPATIGMCLATVVKIDPITVELDGFNIKAVFGKNLIISASVLKGYRRQTLIDTTNVAMAHIHTENKTGFEFTNDEFKVGDKVIVCASEGKHLPLFLIGRAITGGG